MEPEKHNGTSLFGEEEGYQGKETKQQQRQMENVEQRHKGRRKHSRIDAISFLSRGEEDRKEGKS